MPVYVQVFHGNANNSEKAWHLAKYDFQQQNNIYIYI